MRRFWTILVVACLGTIAGCNVVIDLFGLGPAETGASDLIAFQSEKEMVDYFKDQVVARNSPTFFSDRFALDGSAPVDSVSGDGASDSGGNGGTTGGGDASPPTSTSEDSGSGNFSDTTTQEEGVDESDVIKTDGEYVYMIDSGNYNSSVLRIVRVYPADQMAVVSETELEGYGRELYLHDNKVVAMTSAGGYYGGPILFGDGIAAETSTGEAVSSDPGAPQTQPGGEATDGSTGTVDAEPVDDGGTSGGDDVSILPPFGAGDSGYVRPYAAVTIVDVSDPASPGVLSTTRFEGSVSASRMIDGVLHLVLANYETYYVDILPLASTSFVSRTDVADVTAAEVTPNYQQEKNGEMVEGDIISWEDTYRPTDPDGYGVVTVVSLDVDNDAAFTAVGVVAEPGLVYASTSAMYLTDTQWNFRGEMRTTTDIYKLAVQDRGVTPVATGTVSGRILNQYSMGEYQGNLRVATTVDRSFTLAGQDIPSQNNVYVLAQELGAEGLSIIGSVENIAPGESIQSARFLEDRGYLVTFLQLDPFFTLDLSDPRNPQVVGQLKVPGFSTYMTPIDADHILTVGRYIPDQGQFGSWGVQLSIFDVTDFANPVQSANVVIGQDTGADSEAIWDPKAFTYYPEGGMVALPIETYYGVGFVEGVDDDADNNGGTTVEPLQVDGGSEPVAPPPDDGGIIDVIDLIGDSFRGVMVFDVSVDGGINERGKISTVFDDAAYYYPSFTRGVFIEDRVYAVTNIGVRSATTDDVNNPDQSLTFDVSTPSDPPVIVDDSGTASGTDGAAGTAGSTGT